MALQIALKGNSSVFKKIAAFLREQKKTTELRDQIKREREQLADLNDDMLRDIGITRDQALRESSRAYDDIPAKRLRFWMCCR